MNGVSFSTVDDRNLSWFITPPDERIPRDCLLCGSRCVVTFNVDGPTCWAMAMAKKKQLHNRHECPFRNHWLHILAMKQRELVKALPEGSLRSLATGDLEGTLRELRLEMAILASD